MTTAGTPNRVSFLVWVLVGTVLSLASMTIGVLALPVALVALLAMLKWGSWRKSSLGLISGVGLPLLYVAYLNRNGPGWVCRSYGNGGQTCEDSGSPWPWLLIGAALVATGILLFERGQRRKYLPSA